MNKAAISPKDGATRKRDFDRRQREQGRKPIQIWATDEEAKKLRDFLEACRKT